MGLGILLYSRTAPEAIKLEIRSATSTDYRLRIPFSVLLQTSNEPLDLTRDRYNRALPRAILRLTMQLFSSNHRIVWMERAITVHAIRITSTAVRPTNLDEALILIGHRFFTRFSPFDDCLYEAHMKQGPSNGRLEDPFEPLSIRAIHLLEPLSASNRLLDTSFAQISPLDPCPWHPPVCKLVVPIYFCNAAWLSQFTPTSPRADKVRCTSHLTTSSYVPLFHLSPGRSCA